jgi:hypothetical protein
MALFEIAKPLTHWDLRPYWVRSTLWGVRSRTHARRVAWWSTLPPLAGLLGALLYPATLLFTNLLAYTAMLVLATRWADRNDAWIAPGTAEAQVRA